jgi:hypothetical protein
MTKNGTTKTYINKEWLVVGLKDMIRVKDLKNKSLRKGYYPHSSIFATITCR